MKTLKDKLGKAVHSAGERIFGNGLAQKENLVRGQKTITPGMPELLRECAGEGIVLLKNEQDTLPLKNGERVSVFGRCQNDWFYVGYGSGGDVHPPYTVSLMEGLRNASVAINEDLADAYEAWCRQHPADHGWWGHWPYHHSEMELTDQQVAEAAGNSDSAIVVIGRAAGEDRENTLEAGSYYLTEAEHRLLRQVTGKFSRVTVLLNCGNIIDFGFMTIYPISALLCVWQLGMESGNAVADVLTGKVNPSGKLTCTIARNYRDYPSSESFGGKNFNNYQEDIFVGYRYFTTFAPDRVLYPFGYGLSYTRFALSPLSCERSAADAQLRVSVTNTGPVPGKEVVQVYCMPPEGRLSKAAKNLVSFGKTRLLLPGETQVLNLTVRDIDCASFDDMSHVFLLESGIYRLIVGNSSNADLPAGELYVEETKLLRQCADACGPVEPFAVLTNQGLAAVNTGNRDLKQRILNHLPQEIPYTGDRGIKLADVLSGGESLDSFIAQLTVEELADLSRGEGPMNSALGTAGNAGAFGGITEALRLKGIPPMITADGPSGIRLQKYTSLLPIGTAIGCSWNEELTQRVYEAVGAEAAALGVDVLLAPGMNIQRNPLCGRNFEYYSEDPFLTGKTAAAAVRGLQQGGVSACPKHFVCNNQEVNRNRNDSRLSARALREIYLKGFEICVKEGKPRNIMTSYNKINGVWAHYCYDLVETILRGEWGYEGNVMTDWWMQPCVSPEFPLVRNNAYRVRAGVDVLMPGGKSYFRQFYAFDAKQLESLDKPEGLTRGELQRTARNVLNFILSRLERKSNSV